MVFLTLDFSVREIGLAAGLDGSDPAGSDGGGWGLANPLVIGGISAVAVVVTALVLALCCSRRKNANQNKP